MTGNCKVLALLADEPGELRIHPDDAKERGIRDGELVRAWSRRGETMSRAVIDERVNAGTVYMTYQWWIGKCNNLTLHHVDDRSRTPEDKFSACQVEALPDQKWAERHLQELYSQLKENLAETAAAQHVEPTCEGAE